MNTNLTTSWMWADNDGGVEGAKLDTDTQKVEWMDGIGCACGDSFAQQSFRDFLASGPRFGSPPADVLEEMQASVAAKIES